MTQAINNPFVLGRVVDLLYRNLRLGQIVSMANAVLLAGIAADHVSPLPLGLWLVLACAVAGIRIATAVRYAASPEARRREDADLWRNRALRGAASSGLIWAGGALLLMHNTDTVLQIFTAFVMAGMVAGAVPVLSAERMAFRLFAWPIVGAVIIGSLGSDSTHLAMSIMSGLFLVIATRSADYFNQTLHETFRLEQEKDGLYHELETALHDAKLSNRMKVEFLANISHELRTPMNGIIGLAELLSFEDLTEAQRELLDPLRQSAADLLRLISNLIQLSALEAGQVQFNPAPFAVNEFLDSLVSRHRKAAEAKGLSFDEQVAEDLPSALIGDIEHLRQALGILVENALKFTNEGGIRVAVEQVTMDTSLIRLRFSVTDTGIGIAPEVLPQLNGLLVQADGSTIRRHGGIGVGLPIARKLIELMGGKLSIVSQPGVGSTFSFELPFMVA